MIQKWIKAYFSSLTPEELWNLLGGKEKVIETLIADFKSLSSESREKLRNAFLGDSLADLTSAVKMKVQKIDPEAKLPSYAYRGDAGLDIYSIEEIVIPPGEVRAVRTGIKISFPASCVGFMKGKTGLALEHKLCTVAEVVDSNYRGEMYVILHNFGKEPYCVKKFHKISQLVIFSKHNVEIEVVETLDATDRGEKAFGSSGLD